MEAGVDRKPGVDERAGVGKEADLKGSAGVDEEDGGVKLKWMGRLEDLRRLE